MSGKLVVATKYGAVDCGSTAAIHGEGPNVDGFKMTDDKATESVESLNKIYPGLGTDAEIFAESKQYFD